MLTQEVSKKVDKAHELDLIAKKLMIHAGLCDNLGLEYGKTGFVIFFYKYYRHTCNPVIELFAEELLDDLFNCIKDYQYDYRQYLCGIALGIDYLIQNRYIDVDEDMMLDFDNQIMEYQIHNTNFDNGIRGAGYYILSRYRKKNCSLTEEYIRRIADLLQTVEPDNLSFFSLRQQIRNLLNGSNYFSSDIISVLLNNNMEENANITHFGIKNGLTGVGLQLLHQIESS